MARSKKIMIITFIHHSSFLVETDSLYLLFDYFRGTLPELDPAKPLYVLTTYSALRPTQVELERKERHDG